MVASKHLPHLSLQLLDWLWDLVAKICDREIFQWLLQRQHLNRSFQGFRQFCMFLQLKTPYVIQENQDNI